MTGRADRPAVLVDSHHHLLDPCRFDYQWLAGDRSRLRRRFWTQELAGAASDLVEATVVVQADSCLEETRALLEAAQESSLIAAVVGWVDLLAPDVEGQLQALRQDDGGAALRGIRFRPAPQLGRDWPVDPALVGALASLARFGLSFDLLVRPPELPAVVRLARALPGLRLVIDHCARPDIAGGEWSEWLQPLRELKGAENVYCKISGLATLASPGWTAAQLEPYVSAVLELFGPARCMIGSDWPVCLMAGGYKQVIGALLETLAPLSVGERESVCARTAIRFYGVHRLQGAAA